jgi:hypothetical protein
LVLSYQTPMLTSAVTVRSCFDAIEAQLCGNVLAAQGIDYYIMNQNTNTLGPYAGFSRVEVQVREEDARRAAELLARFQADPLDVEPEEPGGADQVVSDPSGKGTLAVAAAYETARELFDAAATLGASRIDSYLPSLVPRGDRTRGSGKRFLLHVRDDDLERAKEVLAQSAPDDDDEPCCPACGSWRVAPASRPWPGLVKFLLGSGNRGPEEMECLRCKHRWEP